MRLARRTGTIDDRADAQLATLAATGDNGAFEELYRRHADTAWRVAQAVAGNPDDAADAVSDAFVKVLGAVSSGQLEDPSRFRPYLLTATRNAALDQIRKGGRVRPTEDAKLDRRSERPEPDEEMAAGSEVVLVSAAFRDLPERWRSVLWLTEVEGMPPREAAELLGLTANTTAQLAVRARAGLRERYLQAHLQGGVDRSCKFTVDRLGAYVAGRLSPRDTAKVDQHLAGCDACRAKRDELEQVGSTLRRVVLPLPLLLGPAVATRWKEISATSVADTAEGWLHSLTSAAQKPLMAASTGIFALGVIAATVMGGPNGPLDSTVGRQADPLSPSEQTTGTQEVVLATNPGSDPFAGFDTALSASLEEFATPDEPGDGGGAAGPGDAPSGGDPGGTAPGDPEEVVPVAQATTVVTLGPVEATLSVGAGDGSCVGGSLEPGGSLGCQAETETEEDAEQTVGITVETDSSILEPINDQNISVGF